MILINNYLTDWLAAWLMYWLTNYLTYWSRNLLEYLKISWLCNRLPEASLLCSQNPDTRPWEEPDDFSPHSPMLHVYNLLSYFSAILTYF